ncbi:MAG: hypothetical protein KDE45_09630, partial [Caldilineaceae bacterium]|nr:hypothetical protein [Caldilineaceae bacterium]
MEEKIELTANEREWLEFLRLISMGSDPRLTLRRVQLLRRLWPFFTSSGSKLLSRSRGNATGNSPSCPFRTLLEVP